MAEYISFIMQYIQDLQVIKMKIAAESMCYVATLNHTYNALPEALLNATSPVNESTTSFTLFRVFIRLNDKVYDVCQ